MTRVYLAALCLVSLAACGGGSHSSADSGTTQGTGSTPQISISVSPATVNLAAGATQQFTAAVSGTSNTTVQWQVNGVAGGSPATGTVSNTGMYTAPGTLTAATQFTITALVAADPAKTANSVVSVSPPPPPPPPPPPITVSVSPQTATLAAGTSSQFTATVQGSSNTAVTWAVDGIAGGNSAIGTIGNDGAYTAPGAAGAHTVTATSVANTSASASATVAVISMSISPTSTQMAQGASQQFTATVTGTSNTGVSWSVDGVTGGNNTTGIINSSGLYTAPGAEGQHTVAATSAALSSYSVTAAVTVTQSQQGVVPVLTYHNDDTRQGVNSKETTLNTGNVNSQQFGKLYHYPVDGQIYAQPLYVPNLMVAGVQHNVVFVATENDTVYAFDANGLSSQPLWQKHLATAVPNNDSEGVSPILGITSTPVIDAITNTIYVLSEGEEPVSRTFKLHALDLSTGDEKFGGPTIVTGSVSGTGIDSDNGKITLERSCYQRTGLALDPASNAIYLGFGHCNHGWLLAYDKATLQQTAIMNTTPDGAGGGVWASGGTPVVDDNSGDLYLIVGVDLDDPIKTGYNNAFVRLADSDLSVSDYFIPTDTLYLSDNDADEGSGAAIFMPDNASSTPHELIGGGKDGRIFVINRDNMGQLQMSDHVIQTVQTGVQTFDNIFSTPALWNGNIYYHCERDVLKDYSWNNTTGLLSTSPISEGKFKLGAHGATVSISSNGNSDGIVWEIDNSNRGKGPSILRAYDANDLGNELYDSSQSGNRDTAGSALKFTVPTVADGQVFVGTANELDIYGLLPH